MRSTQITFDLPTTADEHAFLQEYLVPVWDRFEEHTAFESGWFWRAGGFARSDLAELSREQHDLDRLDPGTITFVINGKPAEIVDQERPTWESFRDDGLLVDWDQQSYQPEYENAKTKLHEKYGKEGGEHAYELRTLAAETTVEWLARFDEPLPAVGNTTDSNPVPIGAWAMIHFLFKHQGYSWTDEIDACSKAIRNRLVSLAAFTSEAQAREALAATVAEIEAVEDRLEDA